jgi:hypothetical protein
MMRPHLAGATAIVLLAGSYASAGLAAADTATSPPYVDHAEWAHWGDLSSLRVYPTPAGREVARQANEEPAGDEAWREVLALAPEADTAGMREQFLCHWTFAEVAQPGKTSWNLEPWRPVVDEDTMVGTGCNPGGTEEPF